MPSWSKAGGSSKVWTRPPAQGSAPASEQAKRAGSQLGPHQGFQGSSDQHRRANTSAAMVHRGRFRLVRESPRNQALLKKAVRRASLPRTATQHAASSQRPTGLRPGKLKSLTWTRASLASPKPAAAVSSPQAYMQRKLEAITAGPARQWRRGLMPQMYHNSWHRSSPAGTKTLAKILLARSKARLSISRTPRQPQSARKVGDGPKAAGTFQRSGLRSLVRSSPAAVQASAAASSIVKKAAAQKLRSGASPGTARRPRAMRLVNTHCPAYCRTGRCLGQEKGTCRYLHKPDTVAVCPRWVQGKCSDGKCRLQHRLCPDLMPICTFFLQGLCSNASCPYLHVRLDPAAPTCPAFLRGYCPKGAACLKKHVTPRMVREDKAARTLHLPAPKGVSQGATQAHPKPGVILLTPQATIGLREKQQILLSTQSLDLRPDFLRQL
ncbi:hypothetical protein WJX73_008877 [Symbiochloris irregularis]|uniref:C3H1-type domain-containing protein n=1 Tax=Symbiochloris irregularis TaxID=706552 RepID=A0AAW1NLN1_9CHLO